MGAFLLDANVLVEPARSDRVDPEGGSVRTQGLAVYTNTCYRTFVLLGSGLVRPPRSGLCGVRLRCIWPGRTGRGSRRASRFFPSSIGTSPIAHAHLIDPQAALGDLDRISNPKPKRSSSIGIDWMEFAAERVAGLHVAHVHVGQGVGDQGEDPVADRVPKIKHAMRAGASVRRRRRPFLPESAAAAPGTRPDRIPGPRPESPPRRRWTPGCPRRRRASLPCGAGAGRGLPGRVGPVVPGCRARRRSSRRRRRSAQCRATRQANTGNHLAQGGLLVVDGHDSGQLHGIKAHHRGWPVASKVASAPKGGVEMKGSSRSGDVFRPFRHASFQKHFAKVRGWTCEARGSHYFRFLPVLSLPFIALALHYNSLMLSAMSADQRGSGVIAGNSLRIWLCVFVHSCFAQVSPFLYRAAAASDASLLAVADQVTHDGADQDQCVFRWLVSLRFGVERGPHQVISKIVPGTGEGSVIADPLLLRLCALDVISRSRATLLASPVKTGTRSHELWRPSRSVRTSPSG